jgi:hypothetical protein
MGTLVLKQLNPLPSVYLFLIPDSSLPPKTKKPIFFQKTGFSWISSWASLNEKIGFKPATNSSEPVNDSRVLGFKGLNFKVFHLNEQLKAYQLR